MGRWGSVEPLIDKYPGVSPYCYAFDNSLKLIDKGGNDAIVTIKGNTITFHVKYYYYVGPKIKTLEPFDKEATKTLNKHTEAGDLWTEAGRQVEYDGKIYDVKFNVSKQSTKDVSIINNIIARRWDNGENIALNMPSRKNPAVKSGNQLYIVSEKSKTLPANYVSHELGHTMGLGHPTENESEQRLNTDVMGNHPFHNPPSSENIIQLLNLLDFSKETQIIKGFIPNNNDEEIQ